VIAICSAESYTDFPRLKETINEILPSCAVEAMPPVDAFALEEIMQRCEKALEKHLTAQWIFNITAATTIMSIAAYEVAKKYQQTCWYLNTSQTRIITLVGDRGDESIFYIEVPQYVAAYSRSLELGDLEERRDYCEQQWLPFAQQLGKNPQQAALLKKVMKAIDKTKIKRPKKDEPKRYTLEGFSNETYNLLEQAQQLELLSELHRATPSSFRFCLTHLQDNFLNGAWLEAYVWDEARKVQLFDDCQWNRKIISGDLSKELDVAMTYKAQLLVVECKTGDDSEDTATLNKLEAVANLLGGKFVGKILVTSLFSPNGTDLNKLKGHNEFLAKADSQSIVVAMGENLPDIGSRLQKEAKDPTYKRI